MRKIDLQSRNFAKVFGFALFDFGFWGVSSVGRARCWQRRGQGFDPPTLHHFDFLSARFLKYHKYFPRLALYCKMPHLPHITHLVFYQMPHVCPHYVCLYAKLAPSQKPTKAYLQTYINLATMRDKFAKHPRRRQWEEEKWLEILGILLALVWFHRICDFQMRFWL